MSEEKKKNHANKVHNEVTKALKLREMLTSDELDEKLILDTIEGETNLKELLLEVEQEIFEKEAMAEAVLIQIKKLQSRKSRLDKTTTTLRTIILSAMDKAGIETIGGNLATLSVKEIKPEIIYNDESLIPARFFKKQPPIIDRKSLFKALKEGEEVDGAELSGKRLSLQIRRA